MPEIDKEEGNEYYCTSCNSAVSYEDKLCPSCGANLEEIIDNEENPEENTVLLSTFNSRLDAQVAVAHLEAHGIDAIISGDDSGSWEPFFQLSRGVRVLVLESKYEKALEVLEAMDN